MRFYWTCPVLALTRFKVSSSPNDQGNYLDLQGRPEGLLAWILTLLGIQPITTLTVSAGEVRLRSRSLFADTNVLAPLPQVAVVTCAYGWPIKLLMLGVFFLLGGLGAIAYSLVMGLIFVVVGLGILVWAYLNRGLTLWLQTSASSDILLHFKANSQVNFQSVLHAVDIIRWLIQQASSGTEASAPPPAAGPHAAEPDGAVPAAVSSVTPATVEDDFASQDHGEAVVRTALEEVRRMVKDRRIKEAASQLRSIIQSYPQAPSTEVAKNYLQQITSAYKV